MANTEKFFLDEAGLRVYDEKIKKVIEDGDDASLQSAKDYADSLGDNYDAAGTAETKVQELAEGQVATNTAAIEAINNTKTGILAQAKTYADGKDEAIANAQQTADDAQEALDALATLVGTGYGNVGTTSTPHTVKSYIDTKFAAANGEAADLSDRLEAVEDAVGVLNGSGVGSVSKQIDDAFNDFATKVSDDSVVNTYKELIDYAASHGAEFTELVGIVSGHTTSITQNTSDISANSDAIEFLQGLIGELPSDVTNETVISYLKKKIEAEETRATGVENDLGERLDAIEALVSDDKSIVELVNDAKEEAIAAAAEDAKAKADDALAAAKAYTDELRTGQVATNASNIATLTTRVEDLENITISAIPTSTITGLF